VPLDHARGHAALHEHLAGVHHVEDQVQQGRALRGGAEGVVPAQGVLEEHAVAEQPAAEQHHALVAGQGTGPDDLGEIREPVRLGQQ